MAENENNIDEREYDATDAALGGFIFYDENGKMIEAGEYGNK